MCMFFRSSQPRFARRLTGVSFQDFRSLVKALFNVDDGISRELWSNITFSLDTKGKRVVGSSESYGGVCSASFQHRRLGYYPYARSLQIPRSDFPLSQHHHPQSVQQYPSMHSHIAIVRLLFQFQHPQTSTPRHEQSRPHRLHQRTYLIWGCFWIELLSDSELLVFQYHWPPGRPRVLCLRIFVLMSYVDFTKWQATVLIIVFLYVIPYRILLTLVQLTFLYRPQILNLVQIWLLIPFQPIQHMQFFFLQVYTIMFQIPRALIFTRHFDIADFVQDSPKGYQKQGK